MLNIPAFEKLFTERFDGRYHEAARQTGIDVSQIHRIINQKQGAGIIVVERLIEWCNKNGVDYRTLISIPEPLATGNVEETA